MSDYASKKQTSSNAKVSILTKIAMLLSCDDGMVQMALYVPIVASIAAEFTYAPAWMVDLGMSITATMMLPAMLIAGVLAKYFNKKNLIIGGTITFMFAGLAGTLVSNMESLLVIRAIIGLGGGFAFPLIPSAIAQLFEEKEKNQMMGWMNAAGSFLSLILTTLTGYIALTGWRNAYWLYLMFVPIIYIQIKYFPNFTPERHFSRNKEDKKTEKSKGNQLKNYTFLGWRVWASCLVLIGYLLITTTVTFRLSIFIETMDLGTSAESGITTSAMLICSLFASMFFSVILRISKRFTPIIPLLCVFCSMTLLSLAQSWQICVIAMALQGFGNGIMIPFTYSCISRWAKPDQLTFSMSVVSVFQFGAQLVETFFLALLATIGFGECRDLFSLCAGIMFVAAVATTIILVVKRPDFPGAENIRKWR